MLLERVLKQQAEVLPAEEHKFYYFKEGMDDWVAARAQKARAQQLKAIKERNQQSEELLDKEIELIRKIMMKLSQRKI